MEPLSGTGIPLLPRRDCLSSESTRGRGYPDAVVSFLLSVTFACGLVIAVAHVLNRRFLAPIYDIAANVTAFGCAMAASLLLDHWTPALLSGMAILCWLVLARRTILKLAEVRVRRRRTRRDSIESIESGRV